jgi:hypothetical protein
MAAATKSVPSKIEATLVAKFGKKKRIYNMRDRIFITKG